MQSSLCESKGLSRNNESELKQTKETQKNLARKTEDFAKQSEELATHFQNLAFKLSYFFQHNNL
jgi:hypothetical protein